MYTAQAVMELALVDQIGLELTEIHLPLPPSEILGLKVCATTAQPESFLIWVQALLFITVDQLVT